MASLSWLWPSWGVKCGQRRGGVVIIRRRIILTWGHCMFEWRSMAMHACMFLRTQSSIHLHWPVGQVVLNLSWGQVAVMDLCMFKSCIKAQVCLCRSHIYKHNSLDPSCSMLCSSNHARMIVPPGRLPRSHTKVWLFDIVVTPALIYGAHVDKNRVFTCYDVTDYA